MDALRANIQPTINPMHMLVKDLGSPLPNKKEAASKALDEALKKDINATIIELANAVDQGITNSKVRKRLSNVLKEYAIMPESVSHVLDWIADLNLPLAGLQDYRVIAEFKKLSQTDRNNQREVLLAWSRLICRCNLEVELSIKDINQWLDDLKHFDALKEKISRLEKIFNGSLAYREADIDTGLKNLKKCCPSFTKTTKLDFYNTRITDAGVKELEGELPPHLSIDMDRLPAIDKILETLDSVLAK